DRAKPGHDRGPRQRARHRARQARAPLRPLLPRREGRRVRSRARDRPRGGAGVSVRVLLADDEADIVEPVSYALRAEGFEVSAVGDGEQALAAALDGNYDIAVLDVMMPKL